MAGGGGKGRISVCWAETLVYIPWNPPGRGDRWRSRWERQMINDAESRGGIHRLALG